jgi:hypothetical protein
VARNSASHFEPEENWGKIKWGGVLVGLADAEEEGGCSAMGCATWQAAGTGPRAPSAGGHPKQGTPRWLLGGVLAIVRGGHSNLFQIQIQTGFKSNTSHFKLWLTQKEPARAQKN